jgi:hypothetical protein
VRKLSVTSVGNDKCNEAQLHAMVILLLCTTGAHEDRCRREGTDRVDPVAVVVVPLPDALVVVPAHPTTSPICVRYARSLERFAGH